MLDLSPFENLLLRGGFHIVGVRLTADALFDPLRRAAVAQTRICGNAFHILLRADLNELELSVSMYHEILEAATVASANPPQSVLEMNEGDFEQAAQRAHQTYGVATPKTLNRMLADFGFEG